MANRFHTKNVIDCGGIKISGTEVITSAGAIVGDIQATAGSIGATELADAITPSHVVKYAANYTTTGGAAAEAITITGVAATDIPFVFLQDGGTNTVTVASAACTENTLTITFSANPGADAVVSYQILRAIA